MQKKIRLEQILFVLLGVIILFEMYPLFRYNLFPKSVFVDQDYAKIIRHVVEMGDKKQIFLPYWDYLTTGEFDSAAPIALVIYMITGDAFLGFGIANIVNIFLWGWIIYKLLGIAGVDKSFRLLAYAIVLLPYDFGMLSYTNMMFFCGGQYVYKTMVPVLFTLALATPVKEWKKAGNIVVYVLLFFLSFLTALSGGLYVLICGIAPIVICVLVSILNGKDKESALYRIVITGTVVLMGLIGRRLCIIAGVDPASSSMEIRKTTDYISIFNSVFNYLIQLFNPFSKGGVSPTSFDGFVSCAKWVIIFGILMGLVYIPKAFGIYLCHKKDNTEDTVDVKTFIVTLLISVFAWNFLIMYMTTSSPRYHLIGLIPLMLVAVITLENFWSKCNDIVRVLLPVGICICIVIINYDAMINLSTSYYRRGDKYYGVSMYQCSELIDYLDEKNIGTVFWVDNSELPELMRAFDKDRVYETYLSDSNSVINYDYYYSERDRASYSARNLIMVEKDKISDLPNYIVDNYTKTEEFGRYEMLLGETNPIDGIVMVKPGLTTVDLASSPEYIFEGDIDGSGYLHTNQAGKVLESPVLRVSEPFTVKVNYSLDSDGAAIIKIHEFDDYYGRDEGVSYELNPNDTEININVEKAANYLIVVQKQDQKEMVVKEIIFNGMRE